jgi:hypothetical protein
MPWRFCLLEVSDSSNVCGIDLHVFMSNFVTPCPCSNRRWKDRANAFRTAWKTADRKFSLVRAIVRRAGWVRSILVLLFICHCFSDWERSPIEKRGRQS